MTEHLATHDQGPIEAGRLTVVPANEASWEDLDAIFDADDARRCRCQRFKVAWGELHVGARQVFEEAGFAEITHPTARRVVMRIGFAS